MINLNIKAEFCRRKHKIHKINFILTYPWVKQIFLLMKTRTNEQSEKHENKLKCYINLKYLSHVKFKLKLQQL